MTAHEEPATSHGDRAAGEHPHPGAKEYLAIAVILTVITAVVTLFATTRPDKVARWTPLSPRLTALPKGRRSRHP